MQSKKKVIIFDLDGVLINSLPNMEYSWNMYGIHTEYVRSMYGICMEHAMTNSGTYEHNLYNVYGMCMGHV